MTKLEIINLIKDNETYKDYPNYKLMKMKKEDLMVIIRELGIVLVEKEIVEKVKTPRAKKSSTDKSKPDFVSYMKQNWEKVDGKWTDGELTFDTQKEIFENVYIKI